MRPPLTEAAVAAALGDCYHPTLHCNIVDLGLVYTIAVTPDPDAPGSGIPGVPDRYRVAIEITLTDPDEADSTPLPALIGNRLAAFETISHADVALVWQPAWSPRFITPKYRLPIQHRLTSKKSADAILQAQTRYADR